MEPENRKKHEAQLNTYISAEIDFLHAVEEFNEIVRGLDLPKPLLSKLDSMNEKIDTTLSAIAKRLTSSPKPRGRKPAKVTKGKVIKMLRSADMAVLEDVVRLIESRATEQEQEQESDSCEDPEEQDAEDLEVDTYL